MRKLVRGQVTILDYLSERKCQNEDENSGLSGPKAWLDLLHKCLSLNDSHNVLYSDHLKSHWLTLCSLLGTVVALGDTEMSKPLSTQSESHSTPTTLFPIYPLWFLSLPWTLLRHSVLYSGSDSEVEGCIK